MQQPTRILKVPAAIFERAEALARDRDRSAESIILDGLTIMFGTAPDLELEPEALEHFEDEQLRAIVCQSLTGQQEKRLRKLLERGQSGQILDDEVSELESLVDLVDHQMLLRSEALVLLKGRGHNIDQLLKLRV